MRLMKYCGNSAIAEINKTTGNYRSGWPNKARETRAPLLQYLIFLRFLELHGPQRKFYTEVNTFIILTHFLPTPFTFTVRKSSRICIKTCLDKGWNDIL